MPDGSNPKSSGTSGAAASSSGGTTTGGTASQAISKAQALANCISKAGANVAKIESCTGG
jgi:hypothetical protein